MTMPDGAPTIHPMTGFFGDGRITMTTYRKSAKARNVERDGRAACLVVNGYGKTPVEAVCVRGRAALRRAEGLAPPTRASDAPKVSAAVSGRVADRMASGKRVLLAVAAEEASPVQRLWSD
jgi:hypothetical protein